MLTVEMFFDVVFDMLTPTRAPGLPIFQRASIHSLTQVMSVLCLVYQVDDVRFTNYLIEAIHASFPDGS